MKTSPTDGISEPESTGYQPKPRILKRSRQKEAILRVLRDTASHPTAIWIYDEVRKELPNISLGTVYRNLRLLQARGEIAWLEMTGDCRRFSGNTRSHYHGKCDCCGEVFDVDEPAGQKADWLIPLAADFKVLEYRLEFHGLCQQCRRN